MSKYWISDAKLDDYYRIVGGSTPEDWNFRLVDASWWVVETDNADQGVEAELADIADNPGL